MSKWCRNRIPLIPNHNTEKQNCFFFFFKRYPLTSTNGSDMKDEIIYGSVDAFGPGYGEGLLK